jgi:hypothetical protein
VASDWSGPDESTTKSGAPDAVTGAVVTLAPQPTIHPASRPATTPAGRQAPVDQRKIRIMSGCSM